MTLNNFIIDANITWDRVSKSIFEKPQAKPGRKLRVQVTNAGVVDNLTGYTLHLGWRNSVNGIEGLDIFTAVDATKGLFELQYTEGMLSNAGSLRASLVLVNIADVTIAESNDFVIRVTPSPFSQDASQSTTSLTSLAEILLNEASREQAAAEQAAAFETYDQRIEQLETGVKHEVTNIITTNSDFATTDGFALFGASVATANNVMTITGTGSSSLPNAGFSLPNIPTGAKVYMRVWARVLNAVCNKISIRSESTEIASKVNPIENQWYEIAAIRTKTGALETALNMAMTHTYADSATANGKQMEVKWAVAIQLTEDFGAGMEPTADYTTFMLNIYDNKYFSGTATVYPVQSVAENLASVEQRIDDRFDEFVESNIVPETVTQKMLDFESASGGRLVSVEQQLAEKTNSEPVLVNKFIPATTTDWSDAIASATAEAITSGVVAIKFNKGVYPTTQALPEGIDIFGAGKNDTIIQSKLASGYFLNVKGSHLNPIKLHDLTLMSHDDFRANSTQSAITINNGWGGAIDCRNVQIVYFPNMAVEILDGFGSTFKNVTFRGYIDGAGNRKTKLLKLSYGNYQFSNQNNFENCIFVDARMIIQEKGTVNNNFNQCTFQDADLFMNMESVTGKGDNSVNFNNCWFEVINAGIVNSRIDEATLLPVEPLLGITDLSMIHNSNNTFTNYIMPEYWLNPTVESFWYKFYNQKDDGRFKLEWKLVNDAPIPVDSATNLSGAIQKIGIKRTSFTEILLICKTVSGFNTVVNIPRAIVGFGWVTMPIADRTSGPKKIVVLPNDTVDYLNLSISYESDITEVTKVFIR